MLKICRKRILKFVHENDNVKSNCMWVTPSSFRFFFVSIQTMSMRPRKCADWNTNRNCCLFLAFGWVSFYFNQRSKLISSTCFSLSQKWAWVGFSDVFFFITTRKGRRCAVFTGSPFPSRVVSSLFPFSKERKPREEASLWSMSVTGLEASTKLACEQADVCAPMRACQSPTWSVRSVTHS